ncbi:MAG: sensor histidine kinase [Candidatus Nitrosomaritimum aestuariumsis]
MQFIFGPGCRIVVNVLLNCPVLSLIADDSFVIVTLPEACTWRLLQLVNGLGGDCFEGTNQLTQSLQENQDEMIKNERLSAIGELSAKIAHDIRNPLNNIKLSLDIIDKKTSNEKLKEYFDKIDDNIFRISHQVNDVLNFLYKNRLKKEEVNIGNLIRTSIQNIPIPETISLEISESTFKVNVDSIQLERAFTNLILNSVQAIGNKKGKITISIEEKDSICYITIEDSGTGIDSQNMDKIFEPLFTTKQQGTGLGLATVKNIIEMHNGSVNVEINPTRFIIKIPKY